MTRVELVTKAFEILNDARNCEMKVSDIHEDESGAVYFTIQYKNSNWVDNWSFPNSWFNPDHTHSTEVRTHLKEVPENLGDEAKIIWKMIIYLYYNGKKNNYF